MKKILTITLMLVLTFAVFAVVKTKYEVKPDACIGCKLCVDKCPVEAIKMVDGKAVIDKEKCIGCGICVNKCPVTAIVKSEPVKNEAIQKKNVELKDVSPAKAAAPVRTSKEFTHAKKQKAKQLGKKVETFNEETNELKARSEKYKKIKDSHKTQKSPCGTHPCTETGEETKEAVHKAESKVADTKDNIVYSVKSKDCIGCKICVKKCPVGAIEMKKGKAVIDQKKCIDCGICEKACPVKAIEKKEK